MTWSSSVPGVATVGEAGSVRRRGRRHDDDQRLAGGGQRIHGGDGQPAGGPADADHHVRTAGRTAPTAIPTSRLSAAASSGLGVRFSASGTGCTVAGATVHIAGGGKLHDHRLAARRREHERGPDVSRSFTIAKATQTITFAALPNRTEGDPDFGLARHGVLRPPGRLHRDRRLHQQRQRACT